MIPVWNKGCLDQRPCTVSTVQEPQWKNGWNVDYPPLFEIIYDLRYGVRGHGYYTTFLNVHKDQNQGAVYVNCHNMITRNWKVKNTLSSIMKLFWGVMKGWIFLGNIQKNLLYLRDFLSLLIVCPPPFLNVDSIELKYDEKSLGVKSLVYKFV